MGEEIGLVFFVVVVLWGGFGEVLLGFFCFF